MRPIAAVLMLLACAVSMPRAWADQYEWVDLPTARAALAKIRRGDVVHLFCAPCGDNASTRMTVRSVGIDRVWDPDASSNPYVAPRGQSYWTIALNDRHVDLAYVYVRDGRRWRNLASLLGLDPFQAPAVLDEAQTGRRWACGHRTDNSVWPVFNAARDPCPLPPDTLEAMRRAYPGW